jgi:XTP/dITP diphosphohydrolase
VRLLLASGNPKKRRELEAWLAPLGVEVVGPDEAGELPYVEEDRDTFAGNAALKARSAALATGIHSLADDSGLEVDALDGAPGVRSARFSGPDADDERNNDHLLALMQGVPDDQRGARFVCALALARPDGEIALEVRGTARGRILRSRRGDRDFGYDPLFLFDEPGHAQTGHTFAELSTEEKSAISHRGRALAALAGRLHEALGAGSGTPPGASPDHP